MKIRIEKDIVKKVKDSEELINYIIKDETNEVEFKQYDKDYFFKNFDKTVLEKI